MVSKTHPCLDKETGLYHGWVCDLCLKIYPTKELALRCKEAHDELEADYVFATGKRFPLEIIVKRKKGTILVEIATYNLEKVEKIEKGKVVRTEKE